MARIGLFLWLLAVIVAAWAAERHEEDGRRPLTDTILHFEPVSYDPAPVRAEHERVRRSHAGGRKRDSLQLSLEAFGREFTLNLRPSRQVFDSAVRFKVGGAESTVYDRTTFYQGKVVGDSKSRVSGHVIDGVFDGIIATSDGEYHVESSGKFFSEPRDFHSVIYQTKDVVFPESTCAKADLMNELRKIQATAKPVKRQQKRATPLADRSPKEQTLSGLFRNNHQRQKRATTINGNRFCQVLVAADSFFNDAIGGGDPEATMAEIVTIFSQVQGIFGDSDFDEDGTPDGIIPLIATIDILDANTPGFSAPNIPVQDFLDLWSQEDHSDFCLALLLTYRDFANGVLGLAWVAEPPGGNRGGICEDPVRISVGTRSLNSAIVTALNFGSRQSRAVIVITISHEFGHNFGSPHDPSIAAPCSPGGSAGNFLMFPRATDGRLPNNRLFSSCSVEFIRPVLEADSGCFSSTGAFCGNGIVEDGEECDCGTDEQCLVDPCCEPGCMLLMGAVCSPSQPCCSSACGFQPSTFSCAAATECTQEVFCTGDGGSCPDPLPRPDPMSGRLQCNNNNSFCVDGVCSGSMCQLLGSQDCQCTENVDQLCDLCCLNGGECVSTFILANMGVIPAGSGQRLESGRTCNDFNGYCNTDDPPSCIIVDNEEALDDLLDLFSIETFNNIRIWLSTYWYVPIAVVVVLVIIMLLLHVTYRKRAPIKKSFRDARNSIRRGHTPSEVARQQTGGVGAGVEGRRDGPRQISHREGVNRLRHFFPTADTDTIMGVLRVSSDEGKAVKRLLELGFPLRKVPIPRA